MFFCCFFVVFLTSLHTISFYVTASKTHKSLKGTFIYYDRHNLQIFGFCRLCVCVIINKHSFEPFMCLGCLRTLTVILVADLLRHLNPPQCFSSHITSHDLNLLDRIPTSVYRLTLFHITSITLLHLPSPLCSSSYITSPHPIQCHLTTPHCISSHRSLHIASHVPYFIYPTSLHFG